MEDDKKTVSKRLFLSPPWMGGNERALVDEAFASGYVAPCGPMVDRFEREFAEAVGAPHACALSSGTAALDLLFHELAVGRGDTVFCSDLTFVSSIAPAVQRGAEPVFIDCDEATWTMDPDLLDEALKAAARAGRLPKAVVAADLYGQCCDYGRIGAVCQRHGVPLIIDAAEALGASYCDHRPEALARPGRSGRNDESKKESQNGDWQMAGRGEALARPGRSGRNDEGKKESQNGDWQMAGRGEALARPGRSGRNDEGKKESQNGDWQMAGSEALARPGMVALLVSGGFLHSILRSLRPKRNSAFGRWSQKGKSLGGAQAGLEAGRGQGSEGAKKDEDQMNAGMRGPGQGEVARVSAADAAWAVVYSFNGNKIITTSGGGMLVSRDAGVVERARRRAQQAREPVAWYEHRELGYNYRMSNIVAAVGVGQLAYLEQIIAKKRQIFEWYRVRLEGRAVCRFMPEAAYGRCTRWLTAGLLRPRPGGELAGWNPAKLAPGSSGRNDECKSLDEADDRLMAGREGALTRPGMEALLMSGGFLHSCLRSLRLKRNSAFGRWSQKGKSLCGADNRQVAGRGR